MNRWSGKHPEIIVQVLEAYSGKLLQWLSSGRIDFALIDRVVPDSEMAFDLIAEDCMAVIVDSATDPLPPGPVTLEDAAKLPLVLPSSRHGLRSILLPQLRKAGLELNPRIEVDSMAAALSLVKIGRYATIPPGGSDLQEQRPAAIVDPRDLRAADSAQHMPGQTEERTAGKRDPGVHRRTQGSLFPCRRIHGRIFQKLDADAAPRLATVRLSA